MFNPLSKISLIALFIFVLSIAPAYTFAEPTELTATQIIKKVEQLLRGDSAHSIMEMNIITPRWQRTLRMENWEVGRKKTLVRILSPKKEEGVGSLKIDYQMWNYLPRVERVIKIPPSMMMSSWMGSDFTNDDLVKESSIVDDYDHELKGIVTLGDFKAYRIDAVPKEGTAVVWGKLVFFVRTGDYVPLRQEYFSESGELVRYLDFSDVRQVGKRLLPTRWEMVPVNKPGKKTIVKLVDIEFDIALKDELFTLRNLKKWP
ncbi:MAG: outer membrane lipoprotein-sorting protein [Proteobacteria bacterium]|nr:outer membrane lipoprotein-sorting protein [Pseudomonadota bacterium]